MKKQRFFLLLLALIFHNAFPALPLKEWLLLGPISSSADLMFVKPYINEETLVPTMGDKFGSYPWKKAEAGSDNIVDFLSFFGNEATGYNLVAYACTYVYSENEAVVRMNLSSDDGVQAWINGLKVWQNNVFRGVNQESDRVNIQLKKGLNRIMLKVNQDNGGWGFRCSIESDLQLRTTVSNPMKTDLEPHNTSKIWIPSLEFEMPRPELVTLKATILNSSKEKNDAEIYIEKDNTIIAGSGKINLFPNNYNKVDLAVPVSVMAGYMLNNGSCIKVKINNGVISFPFYKSDIYQLALMIGKKTSSPEINKMAGAIGAIEYLYGGFGNIDLLVRNIFEAIAKGQENQILAAYTQLYSEMTKNLPDRSGENIHVVSHAHIDMNWLWTYPETKKIIHDNIRQAVAFMEEFPDFTMLQSQAAIYKEVEKNDPALFKKVQKYVAEGRFEPVGGTWTEGDCNLSGGEAICRSFLLGQNYFLSRFGKTAGVAWLPDNFGHPSQLPQIFKLSGCDYFFFTRCHPFEGTFWWYGPDSSKVLSFSKDGYGGSVSPSLFSEVRKYAPAKKRILAVTGVGDHGGGPTRTDINNVHSFQNIPKFSNIQFSTAGNFFNTSLAEMDGRPSHKGEMQYTLEGCYTSVAEVKEGNRNSERALYQAEVMSSILWMNKQDYPACELNTLWETVAFNQFHDILPGSAIYETYKSASADYDLVIKSANEIRDQAFRLYVDKIKFTSSIGQPVVAFNMHPFSKTFIVEAEIYTNEKPVMAVANSWFFSLGNVIPVDAGQGAVPSVMVQDAKGKIYPAQVVWIKQFPPGYRMRVLFVADDIPAGGYKTFYVDATKPGQTNEPVIKRGQEFETDYLKVKIDMRSGDIISMFDKRSQTEYALPEKNLHSLKMFLEKGGDAWVIGKTDHVEEIINVRKIAVIEKGPVRACVEAEKVWGSSKIIQRTYIYRSYPRVDIELEVHWFERSTDSSLTPFLKAVFPQSMSNISFNCHVPFDVVSRPINGQEVPAQQWVDVSDQKRGLALLNKTKHGHSFKDGVLSLSLMRATHNPDIYPNIGIYTIRYSLFPHEGDWKNGVWNEADDYNNPILAAEPPSLSQGKDHATLPEVASLISIMPTSVVMSGIKQSEAGKELVIRLAEVEGITDTVVVTLPVKIKSVRRLNIIEQPLQNVPVPVKEGTTVRVVIRPHEIVTLGVKF